MKNSKKFSNSLIIFLKFIIPFLFWIFLFRDFILGNITINVDTHIYYTYLKYFFNNLFEGVYPLWDPYEYLGRPLLLVSSGFVDPLVYLFAVFCRIGLNYYQSFMAFSLLYFFIGLIGLYACAKKFLKDEFYAYIAYLFILYSGIGATIFNQHGFLRLFFPAIWFFYFLLQFLGSFEKKHLLGLTFCLMLINVAYVPFYFITVFLVVSLAFIFLYPRRLKIIVCDLIKFSKRNKGLLLMCLCAVLVSIAPLMMYKFSAATGEVIFPARKEACRKNAISEQCYKGGPSMKYEDVIGGDFKERVVFKHLFSHLDKVNYHSDDFFFLPMFSYLLIFISMLTVFDRKKLLLLIAGGLVFLIAISDATPLHRFLFQHIFYFKHVRNLLFFMAYLMPIMALFSVAQFKGLLEYKFSSEKERDDLMLYLLVVHVAFFVFLFKQGDIIITSYLTLLGSLIFFILYFYRKIQLKGKYISGILFFLIVLQPAQVFYAYSRNAAHFKCDMSVEHISPKLKLERSSQYEDKCLLYQYRPIYRELWYLMRMTDSPGYIKHNPAYVSRWVYFLNQSINSEILKHYTKNKFIIYDQTFTASDTNENARIMNTLFDQEVNAAIIANENSEKVVSLKNYSLSESRQKYTPILHESEKFRVLHFDVNSLQLKTNFSTKKFLVYNDSFHSNWRVFINSKREKIYRANMAFKGVWLPEGENIVHFQFAPPFDVSVFIFVVVFFAAFFIYTIGVFLRGKSQKEGTIELTQS